VLIFAGNKADLLGGESTEFPALQALAAKYRAPWRLTSAKTGDNVQALFEKLGEALLGC